jgi:hypothetical protein
MMLLKNSGDITYKRNTPSILNTDYVYWSSPVSTAKLSGIQTVLYIIRLTLKALG